VLFSHGPNKAFLVPDSCRAMVLFSIHYSLDPLYTADIQYTTCMYNVRKYIILFVQALETARKASRKHGKKW
jgi:hypothetical protein